MSKMQKFLDIITKNGKSFFCTTAQSIDQSAVLSYNRSMGSKANWKTKWNNTNKTRLFWQIVLVAAIVLTLAFIFSNSLKPAAQSSNQSSSVVDKVQDVTSVIAPNSPIATAKGDDYKKLHDVIRTLAHFSEFALLGALLCWCWYAFTFDKRMLVLPASAILIVPLVDEILQSFSNGRATEWSDVGMDVLGGLTGALFALCALALGVLIYRKRKAKLAAKSAVVADGIAQTATESVNE